MSHSAKGQSSLTTIFCLFSIDNFYDQPEHNLVCWWPERPPFEDLLKAIGGDFNNTPSICAAANLYEGREANYAEVLYWTAYVPAGVVPPLREGASPCGP